MELLETSLSLFLGRMFSVRDYRQVWYCVTFQRKKKKTDVTVSQSCGVLRAAEAINE